MMPHTEQNYDVWITGDVHGNIKDLLVRLEERGVPNTEDQLVILLGDVGVNYYLNDLDIPGKFALQASGRTYLCIHGNHEARPQTIPSYQESVWCSGKIMKEDAFSNLLFAVDGEVYAINQYRFLVLGGAYSIDKYYRLACGFRWFPDEQITESERERILNKVKELQKVDIVLSHTCPEQWQPVDLFLPSIDQAKVDKSMEKWLSQVEENLDYDAWFFGHFHADRIIHMDVNRTVKMMFHQICKVVLK